MTNRKHFIGQEPWLQGLKPRQLAVLFRNNHFSTLFNFEGALYLLVTDQGYLHEQVCLKTLSSSPWLSASQVAGMGGLLGLVMMQLARSAGI
jgi:hypothetical protein